MKKVLTKTFLLSMLVAGLATRPGDVLTDLKLTSEYISGQFFNQLTAEYPSHYISNETRQAARQLSPQARVMAVRGMYSILRTYAQSEDFRSRYDGWLRAKYHISDTSAENNLTSTDMQAMINEQVDQTMEAFSNMPPTMLVMMARDQSAQLQEQMHNAAAPEKAALTRDLQVLRKIQPLANTKPDEFKTQYLAFMKRYMTRQLSEGMQEEEERQTQAKIAAEEHKAEEAKYLANADPDVVIKKQLREFIALAESVDFNAKTEKQGYRIEFVNEEYRMKSREWKQLYRIGREPVLAARDLARTWLSELN